MKTLISFGMAAIVLGFVFSVDLAATEAWEQKLMNEGWVKQKGVFLAFADTTFYGQQSKYHDRENFTFYIDPSGKKIFLQLSKGGKIYIGSREEDGKDAWCLQFTIFNNGEKRCNRTAWKKDNKILYASDKGYVMSV